MTDQTNKDFVLRARKNQLGNVLGFSIDTLSEKQIADLNFLHMIASNSARTQRVAIAFLAQNELDERMKNSGE